MKIAFTICSASYLPFAKSLGDSFKKYNSDFDFYIILLDKIGDYDIGFIKHKILPIAEIPIEDFDEMNGRYNVFELSCALKPFVIEYFLKTSPNSEIVFYLDSDILVFNSFADCTDLLKFHSIIITPHTVNPIFDDGHHPNEDVLIKAGVYNAGFIAVSRTEEVFQFLNWWKSRLKNKCYNNANNGLFVDQIWLGFVPAYFKKAKILHHPGYNVAYWNFQERRLTSDNDRFIINDEYSLVFFHFSGYSIETPEIISKHQTRFTFSTKPEFLPLYNQYCKEVNNNKYTDFISIKSAYGVTNEIVLKRKKNFFQKIIGK